MSFNFINAKLPYISIYIIFFEIIFHDGWLWRSALLIAFFFVHHFLSSLGKVLDIRCSCVFFFLSFLSYLILHMISQSKLNQCVHLRIIQLLIMAQYTGSCLFVCFFFSLSFPFSLLLLYLFVCLAVFPSVRLLVSVRCCNYVCLFLRGPTLFVLAILICPWSTDTLLQVLHYSSFSWDIHEFFIRIPSFDLVSLDRLEFSTWRHVDHQFDCEP